MKQKEILIEVPEGGYIVEAEVQHPRGTSEDIALPSEQGLGLLNLPAVLQDFPGQQRSAAWLRRENAVAAFAIGPTARRPRLFYNREYPFPGMYSVGAALLGTPPPGRRFFTGE